MLHSSCDSTVSFIKQSHDIFFQCPFGYSVCIFIKINRSRPIRRKRQVGGASGFLKRICITHILCSKAFVFTDQVFHGIDLSLFKYFHYLFSGVCSLGYLTLCGCCFGL